MKPKRSQQSASGKSQVTSLSGTLRSCALLPLCMMICGLFLQAGCEEETMAPQQQLSEDWFRQFDQIKQQSSRPVTATRTRVQRKTPKIKFEQEVHDFGNVGPGTNNPCEFKFTNVGNGTLKISEITKTCGCTPFSLAKTEYAPGESGILKVNYVSEPQRGQAIKQLVVHSNDTERPEITLSVKANVKIQVDHEPNALNLVLNKENGGCPELTLTSIDGQPFSITSFKSTSDCITADFDPSQKATKFVLHPKVDMDTLAQTMIGRIEIAVTHPECKTVSIGMNTLPKFQIAPRSLIVRGTASKQPIVKKLRILNNYDEDFELESVWSNRGTIRVLSNSAVRDGYELELQITPPPSKNTKRIFSETFYVKTKDGLQLEVPCNVFYSKTAPESLITETKDEKCKTCGPKILNFSEGTATLFPTSE
jgi:hypothetical protein